MAGGYRAIDSLRLEKGYRVWGADITPDETPYEGGLGFCVKLDKGFIGRDALVEAEPAAQPAARCLMLEDPRSVALGNEPVRVGGEVVGPRHERRIRLHGGALDRVRVPARGARQPGTAVEVEVFGSWVGGEVAEEPLFDPGGERVRGSA